MGYKEFSQGDVLEGPFWNEPIEVTNTENLGDKLQIQGYGKSSRKHVDRVLSGKELDKISVKKDSFQISYSGDPEYVKNALLAKQIRLSYNYDPLFGMNTSKVDPVPHQLDAVYEYMLNKPRIRFLLADDPGAGKTIMAGLLLKELKYRGVINRILIVSPKYLANQWQRELNDRFDEKFQTVDRDMMRGHQGNIWEDENQVISSVDFMKQEDVRETLSSVKWDLVIVDEAHKMAAYEKGDSIEKTDRYRVGEVVSENTDHLLFLTATPHRGKPKNFLLFLQLLDKDLFSDISVLKEAVEREENPIILRRLKEDMVDLEGNPLFPPRKVNTIKYQLEGKELDLYKQVTNYVKTYYNRAKSEDKRNIAFALTILQKRLASSTNAILDSLENRLDKLEEMERKAEKVQSFDEIGVEEIASPDQLDDLTESERWDEEEKWELVTLADNISELRNEIRQVEDLVNLAREVRDDKEDKKLQELRRFIEEGGYQDEKILIFTEAKPTLRYIDEKFRSWGYKTTTIHGDMDFDERVESEKEFREDKQVMIATEAAGEGINLQFCWLMFNYDIPWNPNRIDQRMGRVHRYGQEHEVEIYNLIAGNTKEGQVLSTLMDKLEKIREDLGSDKVFDVVGDVMSEDTSDFKSLMKEVINDEKTTADAQVQIERSLTKENIEKVSQAWDMSLAKEDIDFSTVKEFVERNDEKRLAPEYIEEFFVQNFSKFSDSITQLDEKTYRIKYVPQELRSNGEEFEERFGTVEKNYGKITFYKDKAENDEEITFVSPGHPLVESVIHNILDKYQSAIRQGSVLVDPEGKYEGVIHFYKTSFKDGLGRTAREDIIPIHQDEEGNTEKISMNKVWDLATSSSTKIKQDIDFDPEKAREDIFKHLDEIKKEIENDREEDSETKLKYSKKSLNKLISECQDKIVDLMEKKEEEELNYGEEQELDNQRDKKKELQERLENVKTESERMKNISYETPQLISSIRVISEESEPNMKRDEEVERIAMEVSMEHEKENGRIPEDVAEENLGFDVRSESKEGTRKIEIKGRASEGGVELSYNEWAKAKRFGDEFWLYIVTNTKTENPELHKIRNPAQKLEPEEKVKVRYFVDQSSWQNLTED